MLFVTQFMIHWLPACHGKKDAVVYIITDGEKTILYNNDTGFWKDEVYAFIAEKGYHFDLVSCDCTYCLELGKAGISHMSLENNVTHRQRLLELGAITENTVWVVTHFSHNGLLQDGKALTAEELDNIARNYGMIASYDGLMLDV